MKNKINTRKLITVLLTLNSVIITETTAQAPHSHKHDIEFPNIPGFKTLKGDFHQHTVFSDGQVWPTIRVEEALREGLDAISITDHLEYQPHKRDIPHPDRNRGYQIAKKKAKGQDLIVINGAEITKKVMPPGHLNAIFLKDANKLLNDDALSQCRAAKKQDAFVFWNHPSWVRQRKDGVATLTPMHRQLIDEGLLHGIEIASESEYSEEAFQIAIDNNLTLIGSSDIHHLIAWKYHEKEGGHRPITLIFAKEKTSEAMKEALLNQRTAVYFNNTLIGNSEYLVPLVKQSLRVTKTEIVKAHGTKNSFVQAVTFKNESDVDYILENTSKFSLQSHTPIFTIKANSTMKINVKTLELLNTFDLKFTVLNALVAPKKYAEITIKIIR